MIGIKGQPLAVGKSMRAREGQEAKGGKSRRVRGLVSILALATVAGCSSLPDSLDPGSWVSGASDWVSGVFSGSPSNAASSDTGSTDAASQPDHETGQTPLTPAPAEKPQLGSDERPKGQPTAERQQIQEGLVADRANAQYTESEIKRMGDTTRPLDEPAAAPAPSTPSVPKPQAEAAPAPAPAAASAPSTKQLTASAAPAEPMPPPAAAPETDTDSVVAPSARVKINEDTGSPAKPRPTQTASAAPAPAPTPIPKPTPAATPAPAPAPAATQTAAATPASAPVPPPRPRPAAGNGDLVASTYRERLAEFNSVSAASGAASRASSAAPATSESSIINDRNVLPNSKVTAAHGTGGAHALSALDQAKAAARFEVAEIAFDEGTSVLRPTEDASLRAVVELYRGSKGAARIGIIGHSNSQRLDVSAVANRESNRSLAAERAAAVARALEKMGVPAGKIYVGATGETAGDYAEVFATY